MLYSKLTIWIFFTLFLSLYTKAQQPFTYFFKHFDQTKGLQHNDVNTIKQDKKGYIWITTPNGIQRFDGVLFKTFSNLPAYVNERPQHQNTPAQTNIQWPYSQYSQTNIAENKVCINKHTNISGSFQPILKVYTDVNNSKWFLNNESVFYFDTVTKSNVFLFTKNIWANFPHSDYDAYDKVAKQAWLTVFSKVYLFDDKSLQVYTNSSNAEMHPLLQYLRDKKTVANYRYVMADSKQNIWITTWNDTLYKYDRSLNKVKIYIISDLQKKEKVKHKWPRPVVLINYLLEDNHRTIWVATENAGLLRYNAEKDCFDYCIAQQKKKEGIQYNYKIFSIFQDKEENIWLGTDKGINIFNPYQQFVKTLQYEEDNSASITKNEINGFIQIPKGNIFIGTWGGGISIFDSSLQFNKNVFSTSLPEENFVWSFVQPNNEELWIGCQIGYLKVLNLKTGAVKLLRPPETEYKTIRCMQKDSKGNIWLGLNNGKIIEWNKAQGKFFKYPTTYNESFGPLMSVNNIFIDTNNDCWVSTNNGFKQFDLNKRVYINTWLPQADRKGCISSKTCQGIESLNDSILVIATGFGGINFFNKHTKKFSQMLNEQNVAFNNTHAVKKDNNGFLWFTTDYNLYKWNIKTHKISPYNLQQGIVNSSFAAANFYPLQNEQWLTYTTTEAIIFNHNFSYNPKNIPLKTEITGFKLFNRPINIDSILAENKPINLSYKQNFFTIEFAALAFSGIDETNYFYRLDGVDKEWVNGGTKRFANYTDLKPGKYTFEITTSSIKKESGITRVNIIIIPPFYKTWWFISLVFISTFLLLYAFIKWRIKSVKTIAAEKLKVQKLQGENYKNKLELEQISNFFSSSLNNKTVIEDVLWDVAKNLIGSMDFVDCIIYLWNDDKTKMIQKAGIGPKGSVEEIRKLPFDVKPGQGVVGYVIQNKEPVLIADTSKDLRYRPDEMVRLSEITVPIMYNNELLGIIDCEHHDKNFYTPQHLQLLTTIATLIANKIKSIEAQQSLQQTQIEMYSINEQLSKAKLDALRSQMNPHFIFNCINSIDALIQSNDKYYATIYLNKFAKLLRNILDSSKQNTVTLSKDIDTLKLYVELEQLRHENKFSAEIYTDDFLMQDDFKVPPLIIQPFVENAILHGIRYRTDNKGKLKVSVSKKNDYLQYIIQDNGVGRAFHSKKSVPEKTSYGIEMTNDRVKLFNKQEKASIEIIDLMSGNQPNGTRVTVLLKLT